MNHSALHGCRIQLLNQLVYFDEEKSSFLDTYFPAHGRARSRMDQMLSTYVASVERIVHAFDGDVLNNTVLIGSEVTLQYVEDGSREQYCIVFPHQTNPDLNRISFLSPLGMKLLLSVVGGCHEVDVPSGTIEVRIESIRYVNCGEHQQTCIG